MMPMQGAAGGQGGGFFVPLGQHGMMGQGQQSAQRQMRPPGQPGMAQQGMMGGQPQQGMAQQATLGAGPQFSGQWHGGMTATPAMEGGGAMQALSGPGMFGQPIGQQQQPMSAMASMGRFMGGRPRY